MSWTVRDYRVYAEMTAKRCSVNEIATALRKDPNAVSAKRYRLRRIAYLQQRQEATA